MKHAGAETLNLIEPLLAEIRTRPGLTEKKRGSFYRKGRAWLHFHEDGAGLFADLRAPANWVRMRVSDPGEQRTLIAALDDGLREVSPSRRR
jgi:hypothetical protein